MNNTIKNEMELGLILEELDLALLSSNLIELKRLERCINFDNDREEDKTIVINAAAGSTINIDATGKTVKVIITNNDDENSGEFDMREFARRISAIEKSMMYMIAEFGSRR